MRLWLAERNQLSSKLSAQRGISPSTLTHKSPQWECYLLICICKTGRSPVTWVSSVLFCSTYPLSRWRNGLSRIPA